MKQITCNVKTILLSLFLSTSMVVLSQEKVPVDYKKYPDYNPILPTEHYTPKFIGKSKVKASETRPSRVDNSERFYFPPIFNQDGGSCGSASGIAYMFATETNAYRATDASLPENMYPTHFTWLLTNHGPDKVQIAQDNGIPNIITYGGRTYSQLFGNQTYDDPFGWMTGYDKWYSAMFNRVTGISSLGSIDTPANAELLKGWLWNHNGDPGFQGRGGVAGIGVASALTYGLINSGKYAGKYFVKDWGKTVDHALTVIGYDDDMWCDINGDNVQTPNEIGAWIIANSWGSGWANNGLIYCPYSKAVSWNGATSYWTPCFYHVRMNYRPLKTIKIKMDYSHRSEISLSVGVSANLDAVAPSKQVTLTSFDYCGFEMVNGVKTNDVPMLGLWADGIRHAEPMELGYDLTDLLSTFDPTVPLKYFFTVTSSSGATGAGTIEECSVIDYAYNTNGTEIVFPDKNVMIQNAGKKTTITSIIQGSPKANIPQNLTWRTTNLLSWTKPLSSTYQQIGYRVYKNNEMIGSINDNENTTFLVSETTVGDQFYVTAIYSNFSSQIESAKSNIATKLGTASGSEIIETGSMGFNDCGFTIPNIFTNAMQACTIEFWLKPSAITSSSFQIGQGWGTFNFQLNSSGTITVGYTIASGEYMNTSEKMIIGEWAHIAIVIDGRSLSLYKNGVLLKSITTTKANGMPAITTFSVGKNGSNKGISGNIDEFRVWSTALSQNDIILRKDVVIRHPEQYTNLLAYYQMNVVDNKLKDSKGNNDATMICAGTPSATDYPLSKTTNDFTINESCNIDELVSINSCVNPNNTDSVFWSIPDAGIVDFCIGKPLFVFNKVGNFNITKTVVTTTKEKLSVTKNINVLGTEVSTPDFIPNKAIISTGENVSFENKTNSPNTFYIWTLKGSNNEEIKDFNAATTYNSAGKYTVTLTAANSISSKSISKDIIVEISAPKADFDVPSVHVLKGGSLTFNNKSTSNPTSYEWGISGGISYKSTEQNPTTTYNRAGKFKVKLTAINERGQDVKEKAKYIIVSNENPGNSLTLDGDNDYLTINNVFSGISNVTAMTIEWWMKSNKNKSNSQLIGNTKFNIIENEKGGLSIGFGDDDRMSVPDGTLEKGSWDHFAFAYNSGSGILYKNGNAVVTKIFTTKSIPQSTWAEGLNIGSATNSPDVTIDELRIWKTLRMQQDLLLNYDNKLQNPTSLEKLDTYLTFDETASASPIDYSGNNRQTLRQNIGPVGDMWSESWAFCAPYYLAPTSFTPNNTSSYIVYNAETGKRFNASADVNWAEYRTSFKADGEIVGPCSGYTTQSLNGKHIITGSSEFVIAKNTNWTLKDMNTNYYVRRDQGYMVADNSNTAVWLTSFDKDDLGRIRVGYKAGYFMNATETDWSENGGLTDFPFIFEEVKQITTTTAFTNVSGDPLQQLRFTTSGQLTGTPTLLQGKVSYVFTIAADKWYPLNFVAPIEEVTFQGSVTSNDTVRLGGRLVPNKDYEIRKYVNGRLVSVNVPMGGILPAGAYLFQLKNNLLVNKKVIFTTVKNVQFLDMPLQPQNNSLCGSNMARNTDIQNITGYYKINTAGNKMIFTSATTANVQPFEAIVPYTGDVSTALAEIDLNGEVVAGFDTQFANNKQIKVYAENGYIRVKGSEDTFTVYTVSGVQIQPNKQLKNGCYIVKIGNKAYKVIVN